MNETGREEQDGSAADGEGESVLDEPTAHALDPEPDPNNEWEESAQEHLEGDKGKESS